jgi:hypothetical protein
MSQKTDGAAIIAHWPASSVTCGGPTAAVATSEVLATNAIKSQENTTFALFLHNCSSISEIAISFQKEGIAPRGHATSGGSAEPAANSKQVDPKITRASMTFGQRR